MSILPYSAAPVTGRSPAPLTGIDGASVERAVVEDLAVFYSRATSPLGSEARVREAALEFHRINRELLRESDIVPFRFPTLLLDFSELSEFLERNHGAFLASLEATHNCVQMELWLYPEAEGPKQLPRVTGTSYLREKAARQKQRDTQRHYIEARLAGSVLRWKVVEQGDALRCYGLVPRNRVAEFRDTVNREVAGNAAVRMTGPWPATQFMPLERFVSEVANP